MFVDFVSNLQILTNNNMKKILWLCNSKFTSVTKKATGTWLQPLAELLVRSGKVEIINVSLGERAATVWDHSDIKQYTVPAGKRIDLGHTFSEDIKQSVIDIIELEQPDLIHVWGTEAAWVSVFDTYKPQIPLLLDIQGLLHVYADYFYGGLTFSEILGCIHLKELLMPQRTLFNKKKIFKKRGEFELRYLKNFDNISVQSEWVRDKISLITPSVNIFDTRIILRDEFYNAKPWEFKSNTAPIIYTSTSAAVSYKGLHVLIKSVAILKKTYANIELRIAGQMNIGKKMLDGYSIFLNNIIKDHGLENNIKYLGSLDSTQIVKELQYCNVCVVPSFVETYCLSFAEAMMVGTPTIVSYAGAMPGLAIDGDEALFYNSSDYRQCASYIMKLVESVELSTRMSERARARRLMENDREQILSAQLSIYDSICAK